MSSSSTPIYAAKSTIRTLKNFSKGYTDMQAKVREATSNDPWGPSGTQMNELARATFDQQYFIEIMEILDKRMNDKGKNWRHVFKALTVLDYLLHVGSENVVRYARDNLYIVKTLKEFQFIDEDGKDQGSNVRQKAKDITALLSDEARLKEERRSRSAMRDRMIGRAPGEGHPHESTSPAYERPGMGDDDRDLQRALEESRRTARDTRGSNSDDDDLKKALELSKKEEQDRQRNVEKYNELSHTEEWESRPKGDQQNQEQTNSTDFFANDFGGSSNNNNGFDAASAMNNNNNSFNNDNAFLQSQPTGFNNPYMQFQQQQLQQQQLQQQQMMQEQMMQQQQLELQQQQQQQQQAFMMSQMNSQYQQQVMPQMTGAPAIGSNNPFSAQNIQKASANQPFPDSFRTGVSAGEFGNNMNNSNNNNGINGFGGGFNNMGNSNPVNTNNNSSLGELAFLQNAMTPAAPANTQPQTQPAAKAPNTHDEKYAHLATALSNREDGMDTFGNLGQLRVPSHHSLAVPVALTSHITGASNPFQRSNLNNPNSSLIDIGNNNTNFTGNSNPFQTTSQAGGFNSNGFGGMAMNTNGATNNGAFRSNTLF
ncbi:hypothetical protein BG011_006981 [Mortierella polycephala]|uniref:ENTH domain-containing protein n=1 Tax=Mortierella polycephala TaxID=41804 RepID=A0A9P6QB06_9FUNG|nr:hypothetical protein BG011_006981 [Mortierella polycephala]